MKKCSRCNTSKSLECFSKMARSPDGLQARCKPCASEESSKRHQRPDLVAEREARVAARKARWISPYERNRSWRTANRGKWNAKSRKYQMKKLKRTPKWADLEAIEVFYEGCPKGYHVDHILPLQGREVSGLHVENNLQYLPASENISKGNRI